ncbi:nitroreductase family deazaflavin-dependent oxidoreductase [Nonomuraea harbinensis]|uniref:Nitroreductase family deazaflavin-dependent oxidoreductase n=1 Tax=Nonomuraea harbinensis TaxID=1286938 RepID=A0ABW1BXT1_9ACTN|nr:nitroreductase family deazaflavin-dependent oxidoreductase [Nonomuraea harbinensis]
MALEGDYAASPKANVREQVAEYEASGGARGGTIGEQDWPIVVITSVGAKSGKLRKTPVIRVERDGAYAAVASLGGAPENPLWYHNLLACPEVELQDGPHRAAYRARLLSGEERGEWWDVATAAYPPYEEYQRRTERLIPVFVLERV